MRRICFGILALFLLGALCWKFSHDRGQLHQEAQRELMEVWDNVELGYDKEQVATILESKTPVHLMLDKWDTVWRVQTPMKFNARNWFLFLYFETEKLAGMFIRIHDNSQVKPALAPPDNGSLPPTGRYRIVGTSQ